MEGLNVTASAIISFAGELEDGSAAFYEGLAERFVEHTEAFLALAEESRKLKVLLTRTYQETISDALEACFAFDGLDLGDYAITPTLAESTSHAEGLAIAVQLEERAVKFYLDVAERSESLLATIPRAFRRVAKRRTKRKRELESHLLQMTPSP